MIAYERHKLDNGLTLITHEDRTTPLVTVNILYGVGARDEDPSRTGFAHLFEHLMFGGTQAVPDYDRVVNGMGGESNAFTNSDYTNYYLTVPAEHLEAALRLEADRMGGLDISQRALEVQQRVVTEEYRQRYVNQPYGDSWMLLRPLCYRVHPYRWCTIGADIRHVQEATLDDVRAFFARYYGPANAIVAVAGNLDGGRTLEWVERYFGGLESTNIPRASLPIEPEPTEPHILTVDREVPSDALYKAFLMCDRHSPDFYAFDILSDILSNGDSSRFHQHLVNQRRLFSEVDAYITGDEGQGLFVVSGKLCEGVSMKAAEQAVDEELLRISTEPIDAYELEKVVNKFESTFLFSQYKAADRAQNLCYYEWLGDINLVNHEPDHYRELTTSQVRSVAGRCFAPHRSNVLYYHGAKS